MTRRVLIEGQNLTLRQGTGIATYARNLTAAANAAGYTTEALLDVRAPLDRRDEMLNEIVFADVLPQKATLRERLRFAQSFALGAPLGIATYALMRNGVVVRNASDSYAAFTRLHAAVRFSDAANHHFDRYRRRARLRLSETPDLFHATQPIPLAVRGCPNIYTIHDLVPLRLPYATHDDKKHFLTMVRHLCRRADHIVTVSEHSRRDIITLCGIDESRITNTYQAVSIPPSVQAMNERDSAELVGNAFGLDAGDYYVFVGAIEPKKNLSRLIDAYAASGTRRPLIIVGRPGWDYQADLDKVNEERFFQQRLQDGVLTSSRKIRLASYLPAEQLSALVRHARALLFPSLYEGFGLPVVEAMQLGTPVLTSNVSSLPEVAGDAALLVDPLDTTAIARAIRQLDADDDLCAELRRRGPRRAAVFSPDRYARRVASLYRHVLGSNAAHHEEQQLVGAES